MRRPPSIARWQLRSRLSVVELTLPRQVTPTRAPGDPAQSITVLLLAPVGVKSADLAAGILHLGVGRVLRVSSIAALRRLNHTPTTSDVAIIGPASWSNSRRLHRKLSRAGWSAVLSRSEVAVLADGLARRPPNVHLAHPNGVMPRGTAVEQHVPMPRKDSCPPT
jgi:hypothetical protein